MIGCLLVHLVILTYVSHEYITRNIIIIIIIIIIMIFSIIFIINMPGFRVVYTNYSWFIFVFVLFWGVFWEGRRFLFCFFFLNFFFFGGGVCVCVLCAEVSFMLSLGRELVLGCRKIIKTFFALVVFNEKQPFFCSTKIEF